VSLKSDPIVEQATLPDGRRFVVRVGLATDAYISRRELHTVTLELLADDRVEATVNTVLTPSHVAEARKLAAQVVAQLESGALQPTASAIEPLADTIL
jgi:hypothetical protein